MLLKDIIKKFEFFYPTKYALEWDNVGLQIGDVDRDINRIMTALEITPEVIEEAIENNIDLIIVHHPIFFKSINKVDYNNVQHKKYIDLIKNDIAVYAAHTNVDIYLNGMSDWLCQLLDIDAKRPLKITEEEYLKKIELESLPHELYDILEILEHIGAGKRKHLLQKVNIEYFLEYSKNKHQKKREVDKLKLSFYLTDEQILNLKKELPKKENIWNKKFIMFEQKTMKKSFGIGKIGYVKVTTLEDFANKIKNVFGLDHVRIIGSRERIIKKVAIVGGSGSSNISDALASGVDVLITGDIGFHDAQLARENGLALIDAGHNIEVVFNDIMAQILTVVFDMDVIASETDVNPFEVI